MDLSDTPLDQIGASAHAHYKTATKAEGKANEHYKSCGIYLKSAKLRVLKTRGLTWPQWLKDHCPISRARADEVIAISDGRKDPDAPAERQKEYRERQKEEAKSAERSANPPEKPNENNEGPQKAQSSPKSPEPPHQHEEDPVKEAEGAMPGNG
jgi:hypothetical protein